MSTRCGGLASSSPERAPHEVEVDWRLRYHGAIHLDYRDLEDPPPLEVRIGVDVHLAKHEWHANCESLQPEARLLAEVTARGAIQNHLGCP